MFYDKKIKYLDYYENGVRVRGCGFARLEARDKEIRLELTITGLDAADTLSGEVRLCGEKREKSLTQLELSRGSGGMKRIYHNFGDVGGTGIPYWEICGISIPLGGGREISCRWAKSENRSAERYRESLAERPGAEIAGLRASASGRDPQKTPEPETRAASRTKETPAAESRPAGQEMREESRDVKERQVEAVPGKETEKGAEDTGGGAKEEAVESERERQPGMYEDKWQQLSAVYPHIQPFQDGRDYILIKPADFLLFPEKTYRQANNSFLLHGYYNYKHLLLSKVEQRGETLYYIGVPGNFYEKEKQVALLFGFESFECAEEPAQTGDFGYYMMRVQL